MTEYKELPGIEYMPYYSRVDSMECGFGIDWYVCHHCHETFIYDISVQFAGIQTNQC